MRRKVFLSAVGAGNYMHCNYYYNENKVDNVQYIQSAIYNIFCNDFSENDKVFLAFTNLAEEKHKNAITGEFKTVCNTGFDSLLIPDGESEDELWEIFRLFNELINNDDEVILDMTHSFRSLPVIFIMLLQYLKTTKNITIAGLYYGAFEKLGNMHDVKSMPIEDRDVPIFNLTPFISLHDWSQAISNFTKFGTVDLLQNLSKQTIIPIMKSSNGANDTALKINYIINQLKMFSDAVRTCRGKDIYSMKLKTNIVSQIDNLKQNIIPQLEPVLMQLKTDFQNSYDDDITNGFFAVKWCIQHGLIQQGYTLLQETIVSVIQSKIQFPKEFTDSDKDTLTKRNFVSQFLNCYEKPTDQWEDTL